MNKQNYVELDISLKISYVQYSRNKGTFAKKTEGAKQSHIDTPFFPPTQKFLERRGLLIFFVVDTTAGTDDLEVESILPPIVFELSEDRLLVFGRVPRR